MTPQPVKIDSTGKLRSGPQRPPPGRFSLGGPLRGRRETQWKLKDIILPVPKEEVKDEDIDPSLRSPVKVRLSEEEKQVN